MNVTQTKKTLMNLPPKKSVLLEGNHGIGKSEVVAQAAAELSKILNKPFQLIDFRLAQCEVADLIGMMRHVDVGEVTQTIYIDGKKAKETKTVRDITLHDFAEWFPQDPDSCGFLFLDELFRAGRDIQNAVMELALDYRYHFKELPEGWRVVSASNDNMDIYNGTFPDPALYDRFLKIKFRPTVPEWLDYAESIGIHTAITQYITNFTNDLMPEGIEIGKISPSPRSWVNLSDCIKYMIENNNNPFEDLDYLLLFSKGYLGDTISVNFIEYIRKNYKVYTGRDILDKWNEEIEKEFKEMPIPELDFYHKEIIKTIKEMGSLNERQSKNLSMYVKTIPKESASGFWSLFVGDLHSIASKWYDKTEDIKDYIYGFLCRKKATE